MTNGTLFRVFRAIGIGTSIAVMGVLIAFVLLPSGAFSKTIACSNSHGLFRCDYGRRWSGSCAGWTAGMAQLHVISDLLMWWSYTTITSVVLFLHPVLERVKYSQVTVYLMGMFIILCGFTHLLEAYAAFHPVYWFTGLAKLLSGAMGVVSMFFIAYGLVVTFDLVRTRRAMAGEPI